MKVEHERALMLEFIVPGVAASVPHRTYRVPLRATLFVLTCFGVLALNFFLDELDMPRQGLVAGIIALLLAELLIWIGHWWWTGVEEALWFGGVYSLISEIPSRGPHEMLVLAAGAAIAGARVRNPLLGALAAGLFAGYMEDRFDLGVLTALLIAFAAVLGLLRTWRRPSNEFLCIALAVILPVVGYSQADAVWRNATIALYLAFGLATFFLAIRRRHHALFLAGAIGIAIAATELAQTINIPLEIKLALGGTILLAGSLLVARKLRDRTTGLVTTPSKFTSFDDELEIAATTALPSEDFDQKSTDGGKFGGAGATGKY